jgi:ankyrin repeat protein
VNYPEGEWVWRSCTGNNSQRDNPDLVNALLDRGADIDTRLRGATALHYVAKAGFLKTARVLIARGADPDVTNDDGETPLFYAFKAGKRSDVGAMCGLLVSAGADTEHQNKKWATPRQMAGRMKRADRGRILAAL